MHRPQHDRLQIVGGLGRFLKQRMHAVPQLVVLPILEQCQGEGPVLGLNGTEVWTMAAVASQAQAIGPQLKHKSGPQRILGRRAAARHMLREHRRKPYTGQRRGGFVPVQLRDLGGPVAQLVPTPRSVTTRATRGEQRRHCGIVEVFVIVVGSTSKHVDGRQVGHAVAVAARKGPQRVRHRRGIAAKHGVN